MDTCPLHGTACNPTDPVHATAHYDERRAFKTINYALLYSHGADPKVQQDAWDYLARIPTAPFLR